MAEFRPTLQSEAIDQLCDAFLRLKTREDCYRLFEDLCTPNEIEAMAQRLEVAQLLHRGATYHEIVAQTGVSTATISRINRCLTHGSGGYHIVLANDQTGEEPRES